MIADIWKEKKVKKKMQKWKVVIDIKIFIGL